MCSEKEITIIWIPFILSPQLLKAWIYLRANYFAKCALKLFHNINAVGGSLIRMPHSVHMSSHDEHTQWYQSFTRPPIAFML